MNKSSSTALLFALMGGAFLMLGAIASSARAARSVSHKDKEKALSIEPGNYYLIEGQSTNSGVTKDFIKELLTQNDEIVSMVGLKINPDNTFSFTAQFSSSASNVQSRLPLKIVGRDNALVIENIYKV